MTEDFNFERAITLAENIINTNKFDDLNALAVELHRTVNDENEWLATVLTSLHYRNGLEFKKLRNALNKEDDVLSDMAWHTRNLLELCIWVAYCCKSKENAFIFYGDAVREDHEMFIKFEEWSEKTNFYRKKRAVYIREIKILKDLARKKNVHNFDEPYQRVSNLAKEVGLEEHFSTLNKALSKFVHPTAYSIVTYRDKSITKIKKDIFYRQSCIMFLQSFNLLEDAIRKLYEASTSS